MEFCNKDTRQDCEDLFLNFFCIAPPGFTFLVQCLHEDYRHTSNVTPELQKAALYVLINCLCAPLHRVRVGRSSSTASAHHFTGYMSAVFVNCLCTSLHWDVSSRQIRRAILANFSNEWMSSVCWKGCWDRKLVESCCMVGIDLDGLNAPAHINERTKGCTTVCNP